MSKPLLFASLNQTLLIWEMPTSWVGLIKGLPSLSNWLSPLSHVRIETKIGGKYSFIISALETLATLDFTRITGLVSGYVSLMFSVSDQLIIVMEISMQRVFCKISRLKSSLPFYRVSDCTSHRLGGCEPIAMLQKTFPNNRLMSPFKARILLRRRGKIITPLPLPQTKGHQPIAWPMLSMSPKCE